MGITRRTVGRLLVAYGVIGFALVLVGALIGFDLAGRVEGLSGTATATLTAASRATDAAADAFVDVDASLAEARASSESAATLAREASGTLRSLAAAMDLSILGAQPLAPLAGEFEASADQAADGAAGDPHRPRQSSPQNGSSPYSSSQRRRMWRTVAATAASGVPAGRRLAMAIRTGSLFSMPSSAR